jgi:hypothetical protein
VTLLVLAIARSGFSRRCGLRSLDNGRLLRGHEDPQNWVDEDRASGDDHEQQHEEESRGPRCDAEASAEAGTHAPRTRPSGGRTRPC